LPPDARRHIDYDTLRRGLFVQDVLSNPAALTVTLRTGKTPGRDVRRRVLEETLI
jgi:hypothetical protein